MNEKGNQSHDLHLSACRRKRGRKEKKRERKKKKSTHLHLLSYREKGKTSSSISSNSFSIAREGEKRGRKRGNRRGTLLHSISSSRRLGEKDSENPLFIPRSAASVPAERKRKKKKGREGEEMLQSLLQREGKGERGPFFPAGGEGEKKEKEVVFRIREGESNLHPMQRGRRRRGVPSKKVCRPSRRKRGKKKRRE